MDFHNFLPFLFGGGGVDAQDWLFGICLELDLEKKSFCLDSDFYGYRFSDIRALWGVLLRLIYECAI